MDYALFTPAVAGSLVTGTVERADGSVKALEDAVYDMPELLNEYRRVRVVVHSPHFVLLPQSVTEEDCALMVREAFPADDGDVEVCSLPRCGVKLAWLLPSGLRAFLGRTFNYPDVVPHLAPLCEHFHELNHDDGRSRMFLHLTDGRMDLAIFNNGALACANSYAFDDAQDAAYFSMNAWRTFGLDQLTDELQLLGDNALRATMTPVLREYVKSVMPAVYPAAAMRLGRNAMQAPLELILLALCE